MMAVRAGDLRVAGMAKAWAIVRPELGKERVLMLGLANDGADVVRPTVLRLRGNGARVPTPLYPGYLFVRPPFEQRARLRRREYVASLLQYVLFDSTIGLITEYAREHDKVISAEKDLENSALRGRVFRSFSDLGQQRIVVAVDKGKLEDLFDALKSESRPLLWSVGRWAGTDDLLDDTGEQQCESNSRIRKALR